MSKEIPNIFGIPVPNLIEEIKERDRVMRLADKSFNNKLQEIEESIKAERRFGWFFFFWVMAFFIITVSLMVYAI